MRGRRVGKLLVLPGEPKLVAAMPRQGEERGLLHVLPDEGVQSGESWLVPGVNVSRWAHFKTFYSASVVCDVCHIWCVFFSGFIVPLVTVIHYFSLSSLLSLLFSIILRYSVNNHFSLLFTIIIWRSVRSSYGRHLSLSFTIVTMREVMFIWIHKQGRLDSEQQDRWL